MSVVKSLLQFKSWSDCGFLFTSTRSEPFLSFLTDFGSPIIPFRAFSMMKGDILDRGSKSLSAVKTMNFGKVSITRSSSESESCKFGRGRFMCWEAMSIN